MAFIEGASDILRVTWPRNPKALIVRFLRGPTPLRSVRLMDDRDAIAFCFGDALRGVEGSRAVLGLLCAGFLAWLTLDFDIIHPPFFREIRELTCPRHGVYQIGEV
jgi:hypothetical protein